MHGIMAKKHIRIKALLLALLLLASLAASCTTPAATPSPSAPAPPPAPDEVTDSAPQALRVVMSMITTNYQDTLTAYAQELLAEHEIDLTFEVYRAPANDYAAQFTNYVKNELNSNTVFIVPGKLGQRLFEEGLTCDHGDALAMLAPEYYNRVSTQELTAGFHLMPLAVEDEGKYRIAVLTKNGVLESFGGELRTADDCEKLMRHIKEVSPDVVPGAISPSLYMRVHGNYAEQIAQLFLPQEGLFLVGFSCWYNPVTKELSDIFQTTVYTEAFKTLAGWKNDGLISFWNYRTTQVDLNLNPVLFLSLADFLSTQGNVVAQSPQFAAVDWTQYRLTVLYADQLPRTPNVIIDASYVALSGKDADATPFYKLLQWLETRENYQTFMLGREGKDFTLQDGRVQMNAGTLGYDRWDQLLMFRRDDITIQPVNAPLGVQEQRHSIRYPYELPYKTDLSDTVIAQLTADPKFLEWYQKRQNRLLELVDGICTENAIYSYSLKKIDDFFAENSGDAYADRLFSLVASSQIK